MNIESEESNIFYQTVSEGDVDWLFCVELNSSEHFRTWVAEQVLPFSENFDHVRAWRSISNVHGESDLIWLVDHASVGRHMVLFENKINAPAQPDQYDRYVTRAKEYLKKGIAVSYTIALLSPANYRSADSSLYPNKLSYESIVNWLQGYRDERSLYICSLYESALNKKLMSPHFDEEMSNFRRNVWQLAESEFPWLKIPKPPLYGGDYWIFMRHSDFTLIYKTYKKLGKFTESVVDLELAGRSDDIESLHEEYDELMSNTDISLVRTGKSASFRLVVPTIDPPNFDVEKVRIALHAATELMNWWKSE